MVTDLPDYEKKVIVVTIPGEYPGLIDINHKQIKGVTLQTPSVSGCLPISIEHTVLIDHRAILGEALKAPTFANCVPTSIENDAIAYDSVNDRFKVDLAKISATDILAVSATDLDIRALTSADVVTVKSITDPLPAGTNAIGKLAANSGVDIGDVDVKTMPDVTQSDETKLKATVTGDLPYDILLVSGKIDEVDFTWNADGTLATQVYKKSAATVLTLTYTWNADGTLNKVVRT